MCILLLRDGRRLKIDDLTVTRAKYVRRMNGKLPIRNDRGRKELIDGRDITQILPSISSSPQ